ncbi:MAG: hypothetical protein ACXWAT_01285 [Methylobacter sp.]
MTVMNKNRSLSFVTCASNKEVLQKKLLASPCLINNKYALEIYIGATSAAAAFNVEMERRPQAEWLVWVHQDVFLPIGWDERFIAMIQEAEERFPQLAVAGVYGISGTGPQAIRAGHVLDRGQLLKEPASLPCPVESLDELLFAVRTDSGLKLDPELEFDFYATDVALTALERGLNVAVVDACCEHWSTTPRTRVPSSIANRISLSGEVFERKWAHQLPLETPCFSISKIGDVAAQCRALSLRDSHEET